MLKKKKDIIYNDSLNIFEDNEINEIIDISNDYRENSKKNNENLIEIDKFKHKLSSFYKNDVNMFFLASILIVISVSLAFFLVAKGDKLFFDNNVYNFIESKKTELLLSEDMLLADSINDQKIADMAKELNIKEEDVFRYRKINVVSTKSLLVMKHTSLFFLMILFLNTSLRYVKNVRYRKDWKEKIKESEKNIDILTVAMNDASSKYNNLIKPYIKENEKIEIVNLLRNNYLNKKGYSNSLKEVLVNEAILSENIQGSFYKDVSKNSFFKPLTLESLNSKIESNFSKI